MSNSAAPTNPMQAIEDWLSKGHQVALATVINTWGSSPRPTGSQMAVNDKGEMAGSVSGGCVETAVVGEALAVIKSGELKRLNYGITNDVAWEVGLACGGKLEVMVEPIIGGSA